MSSLGAVLNPEEYQYYYFVVNVENFGCHAFTSPLEHTIKTIKTTLVGSMNRKFTDNSIF